MKVVIVNSEDRRGGAARAAHRLHLALGRAGLDSRMLVQVKHGDEDSVLGPKSALGQLTAPLRPAMDVLPILAYRRRSKVTFYPGWLPDRVIPRLDAIDPDVVHLHWITGGMLKVSSLRSVRRPLVWTLHDMWAFTGGCHYDNECRRFAQSCGSCPVLGSASQFDLSRLGWRRKHKAYRDLPLHIITPSRWLGDLAQNSPLLARYPVSVIPNAIDIEVFRPIERQLARQLLGLPADRKIILFGALRATTEQRKGYRFLVDALARLSVEKRDDRPIAAVLGASRPKDAPDFGIESIFLGTMSDDISLALAYSAADVLVAPSKQENLSNVVMESLACGTPVVAFHIGGMPDMIEHEKSGFLAQPFDTADLARGLGWILADGQRHAQLSANARSFVVENFASLRVAQRHAELYERALGERAAALA